MDKTRTIEQRIEELEKRVASLEQVSSLRTPSAAVKMKKTSSKEFLMTKELKTDTQKTLALGYYLEHIEDVPSFNVDDLIAVFQAAKERRPQNMNDVVNKNIARGFLMDAAEKKDNKKAWVLTSTGEKYVEEELKINS